MRSWAYAYNATTGRPATLTEAWKASADRMAPRNERIGVTIMYAALGRLVSERRDVGNDSTDEYSLTYAYDRLNNRTAVHDLIDATSNATYVYAVDDQQLERIDYGNGRRNEYSSGAAGRVSTKRERATEARSRPRRSTRGMRMGY